MKKDKKNNKTDWPYICKWCGRLGIFLSICGMAINLQTYIQNMGINYRIDFFSMGKVFYYAIMSMGYRVVEIWGITDSKCQKKKN